MAITYLSLVNQKLAYARALLRALSALPEPSSAAARLEFQALADATCFHMVCAYQHYLRELAENYGVKQPAGIQTETDLQSALSIVGKTAAEMQELQVLKQRRDSWSSLLHSHYASVWQLPPVAGPEPATMATPGLIQVHNLDNQPPQATDQALNYATLQRWYDEFVEVIFRHRETSAEY